MARAKGNGDSPKAAEGPTTGVSLVFPAYRLDEKLRNRHIGESGVVSEIAMNKGGVWYRMATPGGMSIGWWHETDIDGAPRTMPPTEKTNG